MAYRSGKIHGRRQTTETFAGTTTTTNTGTTTTTATLSIADSIKNAEENDSSSDQLDAMTEVDIENDSLSNEQSDVLNVNGQEEEHGLNDIPLDNPYHDDDDPHQIIDGNYASTFEDSGNHLPFVSYRTLLKFELDENSDVCKYIPQAGTYNGYHLSGDSDRRGMNLSKRRMVIDKLGKWIEVNRQDFLKSFLLVDLVSNAYDEMLNGRFPFFKNHLQELLIPGSGKGFESVFDRYLNGMGISCNGLDVKIDAFFSREVQIAWAAEAYISALNVIYKDDGSWEWSKEWQERYLREFVSRGMQIEDFCVPENASVPDKLNGNNLRNPKMIAWFIMKNVKVKFSEICQFLAGKKGAFL